MARSLLQASRAKHQERGNRESEEGDVQTALIARDLALDETDDLLPFRRNRSQRVDDRLTNQQHDQSYNQERRSVKGCTLKS
jgi:hypothetical protein